MSKRPLRVAIIGTTKRSDYLYGPLIKAMTEDVELVSVWGRSVDSVERLGKSLGVPSYTDLDKLVRETAPEIGVAGCLLSLVDSVRNGTNVRGLPGKIGSGTDPRAADVRDERRTAYSIASRSAGPNNMKIGAKLTGETQPCLSE